MTAPASAPDRPVFAILLMNLAVLVFTSMDGLIKYASDTYGYPTGELIFVRNLFAFIPLLSYMLVVEKRLRLGTTQPWGHFWRGVFGVSAMYCYFLSYKLLPLSDAIALGLSGPIFLTILSVPLLGEKVGWRRWSAVVVGFVGVVIMTRPGSGVFDPYALIPLAAAIFYALAMISIRKMSANEPPTTIVFYFTAFAMLASLITLPFGHFNPDLAWRMPSGGVEFGLLLLIGTMGGAAQIALTTAFRRASVSIVAPFDYMALVYGFLIGFLVFGESPDRYLITGGVVVVASGIYIIHRETVLARARRRKAALPSLPVVE
ncbi:DMT family transporter [Dongia rigui]|uniref:DMT family transporter n=1 Tax=Dongia rigui TaxID=940149 RepID=A0ABU5DWY6_9PROT|nr:DMT family transporter [Dongia rigui]MDY0871829.1 DMT family transporter [Dongia rigui]